MKPQRIRATHKTYRRRFAPLPPPPRLSFDYSEGSGILASEFMEDNIFYHGPTSGALASVSVTSTDASEEEYNFVEGGMDVGGVEGLEEVYAEQGRILLMIALGI